MKTVVHMCQSKICHSSNFANGWKLTKLATHKKFALYSISCLVSINTSAWVTRVGRMVRPAAISNMRKFDKYQEYNLSAATLQKQICCFNHRVVTLVADKLKKPLVRLWLCITNCIMQPQSKLPRLSYNHDLAVCNHYERGHTSPACIIEHA